MIRAMIVLAIVVVATVAPAAAHADELTVGLYAPTAPFDGAADRLALISALASHLATGNDTGVGRVYARAADFAAAARAGDIQLAVVDASHLAAVGAGYTVLAVATRGGDDAPAWQLVGRADAVLELRAKRLVVPAIGGREADFVGNVLFAGELGPGFFASISAVADGAAAVAAVDIGRADAAVVPAGIALPSGLHRIASLPPVVGPVLVAMRGVPEALRQRAAAAALSFRGDGVVTGFRAPTADPVRALTRRFTRVEHRGPMAIPAVRLTLTQLLGDRRFAIPPGDPRRWLVPLPVKATP